MIHVRRHKRVTASGKTVTVTAHERDGGGAGRGEVVRPAPDWSQPEYVGDIQPAQPAAPADGDIWDDEDFEVGTVTAACPACDSQQPVELGGTLAGHREPGEVDYCPGSGAAVSR